jgi:hypothetical protein
MKVLRKSNKGESDYEKNKKSRGDPAKKHNEGANLID